MSEFDFKCVLLDEDGCVVDTERFTITVEETADPEGDAALAYDQAYEKADKLLEEREGDGAFDYEVSLVDAH